jgi:hypothetical protein
MNYAEIAKKNEILKVRVGSHLFGTDTPDSDTDYEGIFMPSEEMVFGLGACREVDLGRVCKDETGRNTKDAIDYKVREYRDFARLALQNNPNILNILFANDENIIFEEAFGARLRGARKLFPHLGCVDRFLGYAHSQRHKMGIKPGNYKALADGEHLLAQQDPSEIMVNVVVNLSAAVGVANHPFKDGGPGKHIQVGDIFLERGLKVSRALSIVRKRLEQASSRAELWEQFGYDTKFASNLVQILMEGAELVQTGELTFPLRYAETILSIKSGSYSLVEVRMIAGDIENEIRAAIEGSPLPNTPRRDEVEQFVMGEIKRWFDEQ